MEKIPRCDSCNKTFPAEDLVEFEGQYLCPRCLQTATTFCTRCGRRIWTDENAGDSSTPLCQSCSDRYYTTCSRCGRTIPESDAYYDDEDDPYCYDCHTRYCSHTGIHDYYFKPDPIFYGNGPRFMGIELEIDGGGEISSHAESLMDIANANGLEHIFCKHDGSLEDGFEIVSHPMSLDYHLNEMPWGSILSKATSMGYTSHLARTCGLHVHLSRNAFGETEAQQDAVIARILYFLEKHWDELLKFSRRTPRQLEQWAARYGYKEQPMEILDHAKKGRHGGRYTCVNLTNTDTIEFRMFRGTLKLNTFLATLQLLDRICDVALYMTDDEVKAMSWTTFVSGCATTRYPELVQYLKERRLYINEPIDAEGEV